jgi:hypothetical protein
MAFAVATTRGYGYTEAVPSRRFDVNLFGYTPLNRGAV